MKRNNNHRYSEITSFNHFRGERERLILKSKLVESRIELRFVIIRKALSLTNLLGSISGEFVIPGLSEFLGGLLKKRREKDKPDQ